MYGLFCGQRRTGKCSGFLHSAMFVLIIQHGFVVYSWYEFINCVTVYAAQFALFVASDTS
jgi:hypothetical protein